MDTNSTQDLHQLLDALEAGLLQMRQERNQLRETVQTGGVAPVKSPVVKKAAAKKAKKKAAKKAVQKAVKKAAKKAVAAPATPAPEAPAAVAKTPSKARPALGRTLTMIRSPRPPSA